MKRASLLFYPIMASSTPAASRPSTSELDLTNASRGVWLVKVPKYISSRWENAKEQTEVGKLLISKGADGAPEIKFNLSEELIKVQVDKNPDPKDAGKSKTVKKTTAADKPAFIALDPKPIQPKNSLIGVKKDIVLSQKSVEIPRDHKFAISDISHQHLAVFSEQIDDKQTRRLVLEGNVVQKGECRPIADARYMDLKKQRIVEARQPTRLVQQLDKAVVNKPRLQTTVRAEAETRRKNDQKRSREDKDKVMDMLFTAFEKHQYYYLRDLEKLTKQPISHLKDILREIAVHNTKNPHKNMWELKPEYRHYKRSNEEEANQE